jgi:hypothetical protein
LKKLSVAEFNAATECAELLATCENRDEVIQLLESPLNPVDPNYISNAPDSVWQKENESISTLDLRGAVPTIRMSDWAKFEHTLWYAHAIADHHHWNWIGNAKHGDRTLVLKAAPFAEYRRRYLIDSGRAISPIAASQFADIVGIESDDVRYLC